MKKQIDSTYFVGDIRHALQYDTQAMDDLIVAKQEDYFRLVLGEDETVNFINDLDANDDPQSQKWIDFLDGATITVQDKNGNNRQAIYAGFKNLLAYFMYVEFVYAFESKQTNAGRRQQDVQNSEHENPSQYISSIWSKAVKRFYGFDWKELHSDYNAECSGSNRYSVAVVREGSCWGWDEYYSKYHGRINTSAERTKGTIYNYIYYANEADSSAFPNWDFTHLLSTGINELNIL